jgi:hypothetical protein
MSKTKTNDITTLNSEIRKFKMHPDLLFSVIQSQAGSAEKAILEAVMNAVDAGATKCDVTIDENGYNIVDDGKGFTSRKEVDEFFETFGTPHKDGDATYGRFRMGRGQLFAFSSTIWKTTTFEMHVDIKKTGLDYLFKENQSNKNGCTITGTWYDKFTTQNLFNLFKELEKLIKYMQIPVYLNGKDITVKVDKQSWDYKEDDFFVKVNRSTNTLSVYNMGALVAHYPASKFGVGGIVVTKSALKVNFARNDVLVSQCTLWKKIDKKLKEIMGIEVSKKNVLSDSEREAILNQIIGGDIIISDILTKGLIQDISGKKLNFKALLDLDKITFSTGEWKNKKVEERVNDFKACAVISESVLDKFGVKTTKAFISVINKLIKINNDKIEELAPQESQDRYVYDNKYWSIRHKIIHSVFNPKIMNIDTLIKSMNANSTVVTDEKLNKKQKAFIFALNAVSKIIARSVLDYQEINNPDYKNNRWEFCLKHTRSIMLGKSEVADAWTDGSTYIVFEEKTISQNPFKIIQLMIHEYCHNSETMESHDHGSDFYELFHNVTHNSSVSINYAITQYQKEFNKAMLKAGVLPKKDFDENISMMDKFFEIREGIKEECNLLN